MRWAGLPGFSSPVTVVQPSSPMIIDRDVAVLSRDGTTLRVNCYRPVSDDPVPVLLCAHPYGKDRLPRRTRRRSRYSFQYRVMRQPGPISFSTLTSWEAPDPDWWVGQGYAVVNCDLRGAGTSDGVAELLSRQEGEDTYDLIEWAAAQPWSSGKVGMLGVSYLAVTQWRAASLRPPSLAAICPWEGFTDPYRDLLRPGGVPEVGFVQMWARGLRSVRQRYSIPERQRDHPLRDSWWKSLTPNVGEITVPALICGSFSDNNLHSRGSFRGYAEIAGADRYLYTHRGGKWATFYAEDARGAQLRFFDHYLRNAGGTSPPRIRLEVRESRDHITSIRAAESWPPPKVEWTELHLVAEGLRLAPATEPGQIRFPVRSRGASWGWALPEDVEVIGPMQATLWIEAHGTDDLDLFVGVEKWAGGHYVPFEGSYGFGRDRITTGWQRMSLRSIDEAPPTFDQPRPSLQPEECVPVTVELGPSATHMRRGEDLRLVLACRWLWPRNPLTGQFPAAYAALRRGWCTVHWGPDRPSRLTAPILRSPRTFS